MYTSAPSAEELAVAGLTEEDFDGGAVEIWPENLRAYEVFDALAGQWRFRPNGMGLGVPIALERTAIPPTLELLAVPRADWLQLFEDLRVMESAALQAMRQD